MGTECSRFWEAIPFNAKAPNRKHGFELAICLYLTVYVYIFRNTLTIEGPERHFQSNIEARLKLKVIVPIDLIDYPIDIRGAGLDRVLSGAHIYSIYAVKLYHRERDSSPRRSAAGERPFLCRYLEADAGC